MSYSQWTFAQPAAAATGQLLQAQLQRIGGDQPRQQQATTETLPQLLLRLSLLLRFVSCFIPSCSCSWLLFSQHDVPP
jgi:hypothetical protein